MSTEKKVIPVLRVNFVANDEKQYWKQIRELEHVMGITDFGGGYNMGVRMSVIIDGDSTTLVSHKEGEDRVIDVKYSEYDDDDSGDEDYYFIGSKDDPNDELLVVATVRKYQYEE